MSLRLQDRKLSVFSERIHKQGQKDRVAEALERVADAIASIEMKEMPETLTIANPVKGWDGISVPLRVDSVISGSPKAPLHIQMVSPPEAIKKPQVGEDFIVPSHKILEHIGQTGIRVDLSVNDKYKYAMWGDSELYGTSKKGYLTHAPTYFGKNGEGVMVYQNETVRWSSPEELADITTDRLRFLVEFLNTPVLTGTVISNKKDVSRVGVHKNRPSVRNAYSLISTNRVRKIEEFSPEFLQELITKTSLVIEDFTENKRETDRAERQVESKYYTQIITRAANQLKIPCSINDIQAIRKPYRWDDYFSDESKTKWGDQIFFRILYARVVETQGSLPVATGDNKGNKIENFNISDPYHFHALMRAILVPTVTDSQIKHASRAICNLFGIIPYQSQPKRKGEYRKKEVSPERRRKISAGRRTI